MAFARLGRALEAILLISSTLVFFLHLGRNSLIEYDEGIYALVSKRMFESGEMATLQWRKDLPWFDKGPLYFWLTAPLLKIWGYEALPIRFWSALLGLATVVCLYLIGRRLVDRWTGLLAAIILSSTVGFVYYARLGMLDVPNAFFNTVSVLLMMESRRRKIWIYWAAGVLGLGFLNRGLLVFLGPIAYLVYLLTTGWRPRLSRGLTVSMIIFLAVVLPWHLTMVIRHGTDFLSTYFGHQMFSRFFNVIEGKGAPFFWYLTVVRTHFRVWTIPLILSLPLIVYRLFRGDCVIRLISIWVILTIAVFSLAQSKLIWYIMPIYPPLALLVAYCLRMVLGKLKRGVGFSVILTLMVAVWYLGSNWSRVLTLDFNRDLRLVVKESNRYSEPPVLLNAGQSFSVTAFYSRKEIKDIPVAELPEALRSGAQAIIGLKDFEGLTDPSFAYSILYRSGELVLLTKLVK